MKRKFRLLLLVFMIFTFNSISIIFYTGNIFNLEDDYEHFDNTIDDINSNFQLSLSNPPNKHYFKYYKEITINHLKVAEDLTDFPLLISINDMDLNTEVQADGDDIAFSNGSDWLNHEIEFFEKDFIPNYARLVAWVRIPSLLSSTDTMIYMYYGNSTMESRQNPTGVWTSNYKAIWHLNTTLLDSTSNNNDGTNSGADDVSAFIGRGRDYNGVTPNGDYSDMSSGSSMDNVFNGGATISAWIYPEGWGGGQYGRVLAKSSITDGTDGWVMCIDGEADLVDHHMLFYHGFDKNPYRGLWYTPADSVSLSQWQYLVVTYDASSDTNVPSIYINGIAQSPLTPEPSPTGEPVDDTSQAVYIGNYGGATKDRTFDGVIDEVRISSGIRSFGWIETEFNNQNDPNSFYSVSAAISLDVISPTIKINLPIQEDLFGYIPPDFNVEINDNGVIDKMWYRLSNGTITTTNTTFIGNDTISQTRWNEMGNGTVTIQFFANDSVGNIGFEEVVVRKDKIHPLIVINSPTNLDLFGSTPPTYNVEISDKNGVDNMWYTVKNGINIPFTVNGTISQSEWDLCGNGTVSIKFYANDSLGNEGFSEVIVRKEIESPNITIYSPMDLDLFGKTPPNYNVKITDDNGVHTMWYTLNNDIKIPFTENGTISQSEWNLCDHGTVSIKFYANNTLGNTDFEEIIVQKDIHAPMITINLPFNNTLYGINAPSFNVIITDPNGIDVKWYTIDEGNTNITFTTNGIINQGLWNACGNGNVIIGFYANDSLGNEGYNEVIVRKDTQSPSILINSPYDYQLFGALAPSFNVRINDSSGVNTMWYSINDGINVIFFTNTTIDQGLWSLCANGTVNIKFYARDSLGNEGYGEIIVRKDIDPPTIIINTPFDYQICNETAPSFNVTITDINGVNTTWYSLDGGLTNITFTINGLINQTIWDSFGDGFITITFYANNSIGTEGSLEVIVIKDICAPRITINAPDDNPYCNKAPTINIYASDINFDKLWCRLQSNNFSLINGEDYILNTSIWDSLDEGFFQIFIYANDTVGHMNDTLVLNLCKDTTNPDIPEMSIYPTGEVSVPIIFDWEEVNDTSGIKYYRIIIDNEENPFVTQGFKFEINISNTYYEFVDYLIPGDYYFFIYPIDNAGNQGNPASDIFTIESTIILPGEFPWWIIGVVILISVVGSITAIVMLRKKSQTKMIPTRKKVPFKLILEHIDKIIPPRIALDEIEVQNMLTQKGENQIFKERKLHKTDLEINVDEIKILGEELFREGAYLEAIKQFQYAKEVLSKYGRNEDAALFSDLITGIEGIIEEREK
ncbi:MAG: DUF2341 domain-containing protein, partial [Promethearchaeota archaeon]